MQKSARFEPPPPEPEPESSSLKTDSDPLETDSSQSAPTPDSSINKHNEYKSLIVKDFKLMTLGNPPSKQKLRINPVKKLKVRQNPKIGTSNLYKKKSVECSVSNYNKYEFGVKSTRLSSTCLQIYN